MKKSRFQLTLIGIVFLSLTTKAQISASLNGYLSNMQSVMFKKVDESWMIDHLFHNRLNLKVYAGNVLSLNVELRNRLMYGETVKYLPGYADLLDTDRGWKDLTWNLLSESSFILNSSIDRAFIDFHRGGFQATLGRQRINWGMNYIWNPNDVFNSYSFFDFDYVERPGSDGIRLQYYFGSAGHFEIAGKLNQNDDYSIAGLLRFTIAGYDYQLLGGILNEDEYVIGGGFSGYLGPVSFTGEFTFLDPLQEGDPRKNAFIAGAGAGYNTPFNLFLQFEYLYNGAANIEGLTNFNDFSYRELSIRDLSFAPHTFFANLSYPVTPLIQAGISTMFFPKLNGFFTGPSVDISISQNFDLSIILQYFTLELSGENNQQATLGFLRGKWNF